MEAMRVKELAGSEAAAHCPVALDIHSTSAPVPFSPVATQAIWPAPGQTTPSSTAVEEAYRSPTFAPSSKLTVGSVSVCPMLMDAAKERDEAPPVGSVADASVARFWTKRGDPNGAVDGSPTVTV